VIVGNDVTTSFTDGAGHVVAVFNANDANLVGSPQNDLILGEGGNDIIDGVSGDDVLYGGAGNDTLRGGTGNSFLSGGPGNDTDEISGTGTKHLIDSAADLKNDHVFFIEPDGTRKDITGAFIQQGNQNVWISADGKTTITHKSPYTITDNDTGIQVVVDNFVDGDFGVDLEDTPTNPQTTRDIVGDLEPVTPQRLDDLGNVVTTGNAAPDRADTLFDSAGNDHILAGGGGDFVFATRGGDDFIEAGAGSDLVEAGPGNDLVVGGADRDVLFGGLGDDRLFAEDQVTLDQAIADGAVTPPVARDGELLSGNEGADQLVGSGWDDILEGGEGADLIVAGAGNDIVQADGDLRGLVGGTTTTLLASSDTDADGSPLGTVVISSGPGVFVPVANQGDDLVYAGAGDDFVFGGGGADVLLGEAGNDFLFGEAGDDVLEGGEGNDVLSGDNGGSVLDYSQHGNDFIDGGAGDDHIYGDGGSDALYGGEGNDQIIGDSSATNAGGGEREREWAEAGLAGRNDRNGSKRGFVDEHLGR